MMKHEFECLINSSVEPSEYEIIEKLYMECDVLFPAKEDIAVYYMTNGLSGCLKLYEEFSRLKCKQKKKLETVKRNYIHVVNGLIDDFSDFKKSVL